jgi:hypothetical protein
MRKTSVVAKGGGIMVQAASPVRRSGRDGSRGGYRVGASHDAPARTATAPVQAGSGKLPPIEWSRPDRGKIVRDDLIGLGRTLVVALLGMAVLVTTGLVIAILLTTVLNALGFDPSSSY